MTGNPPRPATVVLFRCSDGCTDPAAYAELRMTGRWEMSHLTGEPSERELLEEHVADVMNTAEASA